MILKIKSVVDFLLNRFSNHWLIFYVKQGFKSLHFWLYWLFFSQECAKYLSKWISEPITFYAFCFVIEWCLCRILKKWYLLHCVSHLKSENLGFWRSVDLGTLRPWDLGIWGSLDLGFWRSWDFGFWGSFSKHGIITNFH